MRNENFRAKKWWIDPIQSCNKKKRYDMSQSRKTLTNWDMGKKKKKKRAELKNELLLIVWFGSVHDLLV